MVPQLNIQKSKYTWRTEKLDLDDIVGKVASSSLTSTKVYADSLDRQVKHPTKLSENENWGIVYCCFYKCKRGSLWEIDNRSIFLCCY